MTLPTDPLLNSLRPGVYAAPDATAGLQRAAQAHGIVWFELDLAHVTDKNSLFDVCQKLLRLPATFGRNWDALADSLQDLSWHAAQGFVIVCRNGAKFARHAPEDYALFMDVLHSASEFWRTRQMPFVVLLDAQSRGKRNIQPLQP